MIKKVDGKEKADILIELSWNLNTNNLSEGLLYSDIGKIYSTTGDNEISINFFNTAFEIFIEFNDTKNASYIYNS